MNARMFACLFLTITCASSFAQELPQTVIDGKKEILYLDHWADPANWRPAECAVSVSDKKSPNGRPVVHMHVPVDHQGGELKYPIGWPRMDLLAQTPWERDWTSYDQLEFSVYTEMYRPSLPKTPIALLVYCPDKNRVWQRDLRELKLGEWVAFSFPITKMQYVDNVNVVKLSTSESNYRDKDKVDFHFSGFRLVRSTECRVSELKILTPVLYRDQTSLQVEMSVVGIPEKISRGVPFSLRDPKELLRLETLPVKRGQQVLNIDVSELKLVPGEYTLTAFEQEPERKLSIPFRVVNTPWEGK
ncbi:MAG: hypothetical protein GW893_01870 [Armatimonadetes bacterium]|nr:hypothetical protein [Armatimonadota bacterium]PIX44377.1 MAG: hypothetical protein COZ56_04715 [Armatimonadetes bacterium CG_4_8_14_3_um_filter_58_9]PIY39213.1 MAG: hypothetical protein COZ05_19535 [Armatimonadetes bacterium CG_4_10_14_3_um_filter_59_10]PJB77092.1 MAG: hypothetical protein CO095_01800 [Armatimonadetes bacterium CG_4_9_14_3_um_filter_58_7]